jgi:hypothetical protein
MFKSIILILAIFPLLYANELNLYLSDSTNTTPKLSTSNIITYKNPYRFRRIFLFPGSILIIPSVWLLAYGINTYNEMNKAFEQDKGEGRALDLMFFAAPLCVIAAGAIATAGSSFCVIYGSINWHLYNKYEKNRLQITLQFQF